MNELTGIFSIDGMQILSAIDNDVLIKGEVYVSDPNDISFKFEECIFQIPRKKFHKILDEYLDKKTSYCKAWIEFCGIGIVNCNNLTEVGQTNLNKYIVVNDENGDWDEEKSYYRSYDVKIYTIKDFDIEMEHG